MAKKKGIEEGLETEAGEARIYELGSHLDPELGVEEAKKAYNEIRALVTKQGEVVAEGEPQKIPLAYTISRQETAGRRDFDSAYFAWIAYEASAEAHEEIVAAMRGDARVIRFIDLATEKAAAQAAAERAALAEKVEAPEGQTEAADDAALDAALENATI
ncbi:MAG: 30S ribosomal protein S6 [Patescibacteria group bacterium]|nr:30S ribosomal protein S6 [Patescibacteria group bacterium]MDE1944300.1 30S ribosomal protein S6 [Patescibacteria group bacterium]MDE1944787.1 30S ribosomal protein S6 [Patescibacteria group bacterium]MDE2057240.1 30S ribosomal protein S6 [Patescibacteria group bacterium]